MAGSSKHKCECADPGCPAHIGRHCETTTRTRTLYRVDMRDLTGTRFCASCRADAMDSGLFSETPNPDAG